MRLPGLVLTLSVWFLSTLSSIAQSQADSASGEPWSGVETGVVTETIAPHSAGESAGLIEGDVILGWKRGDAQGRVESPFDLWTIETEQEPHGVVTLEGLRGTERRFWTLGPSVWGIKVRSGMPAQLLIGYREGKQLAESGRWTDAAERWEETASEAQQLRGRPAWFMSWLQFHLAEMLSEARQWTQADAAYASAVEQATGLEGTAKAHLLQEWGDAYRKRNDWVDAAKYYQEALVESQKAGADKLTTANSLQRLGVMAGQRGDLAKAEEYFREALTMVEKLAPGSMDLAAVLTNLGVIISQRGDSADAEEYHTRALAIGERLVPNSLSLAKFLNNFGTLAYRRGDLPKADEYFGRALKIIKEIEPNSLELGQLVSNLGSVADERGDLAQAEEYYQQALTSIETFSPDSLELSLTLNQLGIVSCRRGDLARAEEYHRRALSIRKRLAPGSLDVAQSLHNLGLVAAERGDLALAKEYNLRALSIRKKLVPGSLHVARSQESLGELAYRRGNLAMAKEYESESLRIREKLAPGSLVVAESVNGLGDIARDRGDLVQAEEYYREALAIREKLAPGSIVHAKSLLALAGIMRRKQQVDAAARLYERALNALENQIAHSGGSEETRAELRARNANYYLDTIDLLVGQKQPEAAFRVAERWRARSLLELLSRARIDIRTGVDASLLARERSLQELLNGKSNRRIQLLGSNHNQQAAVLSKEIEELQAEYSRVESEVRASSPSYAALTQPHSLSLQETQELLDKDTLLLEYALGKERSYLWTVGRDSFAFHELPRQALVERTARRVYRLLTAANDTVPGEPGVQREARLAKLETEYWKTAARLSGMILAPAGKQLKGKRLLVVADGALQYIPFAALPASKIAGGRNPKPLMLEHEVVNLPSASVLAILREQDAARHPMAQPSTARLSMARPTANKLVAVVADPVFSKLDPRAATRANLQPLPDEIIPWEDDFQSHSDPLTESLRDISSHRNAKLSLARLPFSRQEAVSIMALVPPEEGKEALDFDASRETVRKLTQRYNIVHFATHALLNNDHPELSGLVFSLVDKQGRPDNGFLGLQDIYNLSLDTDLVVLSACETGLGKQVQGEGLVGLTRGFMYAGANRVVASLWSVDDAATATFMKHFYQAMLQKRLPPPAALRQAQIQTWRQKPWSNPYYWAAFVLQGEWKAPAR